MAKEIKIEDINTEKGRRIIHAFDFPGYEPAYIIANEEKIYLRTGI